MTRRASTLLFLVLLVAFAANAQQTAEFERATGGEVLLTTKGTAPFSGSLELSLSTGRGVSNTPGYGITGGGTLIQDKAWFFGSAFRQNAPVSRIAGLELPDNATTSAIGGRVNGQVGGRQDFSAFFESARQPQFSTTSAASPFRSIEPSSFLSMRYNAMVSNNMTFSASFSRSSRTGQGLTFVPVD